MKINRLILPALICGVTIAISPALFAQDSSASTSSGSSATAPAAGGHHGFSADDMLAHLTKALSLTDDQQAKIKPILADEHEKIQAIRQDTSVSKADMGAKIKPIRDAANDQIKALLTPDQVTKFEALQQQWQNRRNGGGGNQGS